MAQLTRSTKIGGGTTLQSNTLARAADVEADILTLFSNNNNLDSGASTWAKVIAENASAVPLIANNVAGTNDIADFRDNGTSVLKVADGGTTTVTATGVATKALVVNNGTSTGNILEVQDNGTAAVTVPDGGGVVIAKTTDQLVLGTTNTTTITSTAPAASRTYTIPDAGGAASFVMTAANQTIAGTKTFSSPISTSGVTNTGGVDIQGSNTNDNAPAGYYGEYMESVLAATNVPTSGQFGDNISVALTAGTWVVSYNLDLITNGATITAGNSGIGTATGNNSTGVTNGVNGANLNVAPSGVSAASTAMSPWYTTIAGTTSYYLKISVTYSAATPQYRGRISAFRIR
jgi:hypothetical protein